MINYYSTDFYKDLESISKCTYFNEWLSIVEEILLNDEFQRRKLFLHHDNSVWSHSIDVSFKSFLVAKFYKYDERVAAIAGLLHDFYPYAWQYNKELEELNPDYLKRYYKKHKYPNEWHGLVHGKEAAENAKKYFPHLVNEKIYDSIKCHMFPLTVIPPKFIEGWIISSMDKKVSVNVLSNFKDLPNYVGIKTKAFQK